MSRHFFTFKMCNASIFHLKLYFALIIVKINITLKAFKGLMCNQNKRFDQDRAIFFAPGMGG